MTSGQIIFIILFSSLGFCGCVCGCVIFYDELFVNDDDKYLLDNTDSELNLAFGDIYKNNNHDYTDGHSKRRPCGSAYLNV